MAGDSMPQWIQNLVAGWPMIRSNLPIFFVILVLMGGTLWGAFSWYYGGVLASKSGQIELQDRQLADYKQRSGGVPPDQAKAKKDSPADVAPSGQVSRLIKGARLQWQQDGRVSLQGRFSISGGPANIYVTYGSPASSHGLYRSPQQVIGGTLNLESRIKLGSIAHFDREEKSDFTLGFVRDVEGSQQVIQWGELAQNNIKVGITWGSYFGWIIFVWSDGKEEEWYPFAIVSTAQPNAEGHAVGAPPLFIGPDVLMAHFALEKK